MPHISVKMLQGRTEQQKQALAAALKETLKKTIGAPEKYISVTIEDYTAEDWVDVFQEEVTDKPDAVYVKPSYDPKDLL
jgi:4-oxalocrotonate tautomerase